MYIEKLFCDLGGHLRYGAAAPCILPEFGLK